jgi:hypothetical protein
MKRAFEEYHTKNYKYVKSGQFRLALIEIDILSVILGMLELCDVQNVMRCLVIECGLDMKTLTHETTRQMDRLLELLMQKSPSVYLVGLRVQLTKVTYAHDLPPCDDITRLKYELNNARLIAGNKYFPLIHFIQSSLCDDCRVQFATDCRVTNRGKEFSCDQCNRSGFIMPQPRKNISFFKIPIKNL